MSTIISLSPTMTRRLNFKNDLMDDVDDYKLEEDDVMPAIKAAIAGDREARDKVITGHMWIAKDVIMRFRAHFPETRRFTDDMVGVSLVALTEFVDGMEQPSNFFNKSQQFIHTRIRDFINDNRSITSSSVRTNWRRLEAEQPLDYHFAQELRDDVHGEDDYRPGFVDILDAVERLQEVDKEQMNDLINMFLWQNHNIDEADLSEDERAVIERLSEIVSNL